MRTLLTLLHELPSPSDRLDAWKRIGADKTKQRKEKSWGQPCGRGWVGLKGACKRAKKGEGYEFRNALAKESKQELANRIREFKRKRAESIKAVEPPPKTSKRKPKAEDTDTSPTFKDLRRAEDKIREQRFETLKVFDSKGKEILSLDGEKTYVEIPLDKAHLLKDAVVTHNHPDGWNHATTTLQSKGNSFSTDDLTLAVGLDVKEIRAVSPGYRHSIVRPAKGWPTPDVAAQKLAAADKNVRADLQALVNSSPTTETVDLANSSHNHMVAMAFAASIGAKYKRTEWRPEQ